MAARVFSKMFDRFCQVAPVSVLGMISVRWCFSDAIIDEIFEAERDSQYTRDLTFSACVELLAEVALYGTPSVNAAIKNVTDSLPVSTSAIYQKLRNVEPQVCEALISVPAARAARLIKGFKATRAQPISKYGLKSSTAIICKGRNVVLLNCETRRLQRSLAWRW